MSREGREGGDEGGEWWWWCCCIPHTHLYEREVSFFCHAAKASGCINKLADSCQQQHTQCGTAAVRVACCSARTLGRRCGHCVCVRESPCAEFFPELHQSRLKVAVRGMLG